MEEVEETIGAVVKRAVESSLFRPPENECRAFFVAVQYRSRRTNDMECTIDWMPANGMAFSAETGSGHLLTMDGAPDGGGRNLAPRPMETVLAGTGACTAYDVVLILRRGRHDVRACRVKVTSERAPQDPKVFTRIHMHFLVTGSKLTGTAVERAIALSHEKYCSATIMLGKTAEITTSFEVQSVDAASPEADGAQM
jgi:putative redox protein